MTEEGAVSKGSTDSLKLFTEVAALLNEATDIGSAMDLILPKMGEALGLTTAWAFRYDESRRSFVEVGASGLPPALGCHGAAALKSGWCECQDQFVNSRLDRAVNVVRCSRLRDAVGDKEGLVYHASIPLRSQGRALGILNVAATGHAVFTAHTLTLLGTIGQHVAIAIHRAALWSDERERTEKLSSLSSAAAELTSDMDTAKILQSACRLAVSSLGFPACAMTVTMAAERTDGIVEQSTHVIGAPLVASYRQNEPAVNEYAYESEDVDSSSQQDKPFVWTTSRSQIVLPIPQSEYELHVESDQSSAFGDIDREILAAFAWHITAALENARLYQHSVEHAKWNERQQLAADLHDAVSQRLFSALLLARTADELVNDETKRPRIHDILQGVQDRIIEAQAEMRTLIDTLRPRDTRGFLSRLRERVDALQLQSQTQIRLSVESGVPDELPFDVREAFTSVLDEALHNVLQHAQAKRAWVTCNQSNEGLVLQIKDDGCGFVSRAVIAGLGTTTMFERMQAVDGRLFVTSHPGRGTVISAQWPWPQGRGIKDGCADKNQNGDRR